MRAGALKYRLEVYRPFYKADRMSTKGSPEYERQCVIHAERVSISGRRSEEVGEHFPDYSVRYNIRSAHPVEENWRVRELGGHLYTVTNVIPNLDRGMKTLVCERLNE